MTGILRVDTLQNSNTSNLISQTNASTITIGSSGQTIDIAAGATFNGGGANLPIDLNSTAVTNTLQTSNGGTGHSTINANSLLVGGASNDFVLLSVGTTGQVLTVDSSSNVVWANPTGGGGGLPATINVNDLLVGNTSNGVSTLSVGTSGQVLSVTSSTGAGVWSAAAGGNLNNAKSRLAGAGTQSAALAIGGESGGPLNQTESYNGSSWSNVGNLNTARSYLAGCGTQSAALAIGGDLGGGTSTGLTESWDGSSWSVPMAGTLVTAADKLSAVGTQSAALAFGGTNFGTPLNNTQSYNGSSWTSSSTLNVARSGLGGAGIQSAALAFAGDQGGGAISNVTESWDGSSWSILGGTLAYSRNKFGSLGIQSAALAFAGDQGGFAISQTEEWNGTAWSVTGGYGSAQQNLAAAGSVTAGLGFGGDWPFATATARQYDSPSTTTLDWVTPSGGASLPIDLNSTSVTNTLQTSNGGTGLALTTVNINDLLVGNTSNTFSILSSGMTGQVLSINSTGYVQWLYPSDPITSLQPYSSGGGDIFVATNATTVTKLAAGTTSQVLSVATVGTGLSGWSASPGSLSNGVWAPTGVGTPSAALCLGGVAAFTLVQDYNGSTWSNNPTNMNTQRWSASAVGTPSSALIMGGRSGFSPANDSTETYDGTTWSSSGTLLSTRYGQAASGTQSAATIFGGRNTSNTIIVNTEIWDNTTWSSYGALNTPRYELAGSGGNNSALAFGGDNNTSILGNTEYFDGSSWSNLGSLNIPRSRLAGAGLDNSTLAAGGQPNDSATESWNGGGWTNEQNLPQPNYYLGGVGTSGPSTLVFGGLNSNTASYEYTGVPSSTTLSWTTPPSGITWNTTTQVTSFTANSNVGYFVNTSASTITATLPDPASPGDVVSFTDYFGTFGTNNFSISGGATNPIQGSFSPLVLSTNWSAITLVYIDGIQGWLKAASA
jgi:hypothetical protein